MQHGALGTFAKFWKNDKFPASENPIRAYEQAYRYRHRVYNVAVNSLPM